MNYDLVKDRFGSWAPYFMSFIESEDFDKTFKVLKALSARGRTICPKNSDTFRCFQLTPYNQLKAIFVFGSAHETQNNGTVLADGLALSTRSGSPVPGAKHFFNAIQSDFGETEDVGARAADMTFLAEQGVLLLNAGVTCELHKFGSHVDLWKPFMEHFFIEVVNQYKKSLPVVFFGEFAQQYEHLVMPFNHWTFCVDDPTRLAEDESWDHQGIFKKVNKIIKDNDGGMGVCWSPYEAVA